MKTKAQVVQQIEGLLRSAQAPWCVTCRNKMRGSGHGFYCVVCPAQFRDPPWCITCRRATHPHGFDRNGFQRWLCDWCSATFSNFYTSEFDYHEGSIRKPRALMASIPLFRQGLSVRAVGDAIGISKHTAMKFRRIALRDYDARCACGRPVGHNGFCWHRYQNSPKRQEFMRRWHSSNQHAEALRSGTTLPD
jgi:transposase-like protein